MDGVPSCSRGSLQWLVEVWRGRSGPRERCLERTREAGEDPRGREVGATGAAGARSVGTRRAAVSCGAATGPCAEPRAGPRRCIVARPWVGASRKLERLVRGTKSRDEPPHGDRAGEKRLEQPTRDAAGRNETRRAAALWLGLVPNLGRAHGCLGLAEVWWGDRGAAVSGGVGRQVAAALVGAGRETERLRYCQRAHEGERADQRPGDSTTQQLTVILKGYQGESGRMGQRNWETEPGGERSSWAGSGPCGGHFGGRRPATARRTAMLVKEIWPETDIPWVVLAITRKARLVRTPLAQRPSEDLVLALLIFDSDAPKRSKDQRALARRLNIQKPSCGRDWGGSGSLRGTSWED